MGKHRYYVGPEVNGVIPINAKTLAIFKVAYFVNSGTGLRPQGQSIIISVRLAKPRP